jgi:dTDP-4-dehydrorhamnose 3,5-epimerase
MEAIEIDEGAVEFDVFRDDIPRDERGFSFSPTIDDEYPEIYLSFNKHKVWRGFHYQPNQKKIVTCLKGCIQDYILCIDQESPRYGNLYTIQLSEENRLAIMIPEGFAHGFLTRDASVVHYNLSEARSILEGGYSHYGLVNLNRSENHPRFIVMSERDRKLPVFPLCLTSNR